jgi:hypothetical protein
VLYDPQRHLVEERRRVRRLGRALQRLDQVLDALDHTLAERTPSMP